MEITQPVAPVSTKLQPSDKLYIENTLLRVAGALFCHDAKRAAVRSAAIELNRGAAEKRIVIRPDPCFGQPGPLAHKLFVALIKKHSDYGLPVQKEVSFTKREIMRMIGRKAWGGRDSEELSRALHEIHHTFVTTHFQNSAGRYIEHSFNIFPEILIERREFASDPIEACTVTLAEPIIASLQDDHFVCLNHILMQPLGTIGQALYMRLFFHFANLYDGISPQRLSFQKRYEDICTEWLGGLTVLQHRSKIITEQLGKHLDQLVATKFLTAYAIEVSKAKGSSGFILSFQPGPAFFEDYSRFYGRRNQAPAEKSTGEIHTVSEPLRVAYLFAEKRTGHRATSIAFVPSKDVDTAKHLLTELPFAEMPAFLDYALAEARRTGFDVQTLGGIKQYLAGYMADRLRRQADQERQALQAAHAQEETRRYAYESARRAQALRIFMTLAVEEQSDIDELARSYASRFSGSLRDAMFENRKARITAERHPDAIETFEQWSAH